MPEIRQLLDLWKTAVADGEEYAVATVVRVIGSSYRKPGARMLLTRSGRRSGMVSGGCLEGEISRKIWWLTETGPTIESYVSSFDEEGHAGYGLGCGGTVEVLLERGVAAQPILEAIGASVERRVPSVVLTVVGSTSAEFAVGTHQIFDEAALVIDEAALGPRDDGGAATPKPDRGDGRKRQAAYLDLARETYQNRRSGAHTIAEGQHTVEIFAEYIAPPFGLFIFGAGDDAQPLAELAHLMGWHVTVADGRSNLVRSERFPLAEAMQVLPPEAPLRELKIDAGNGAVLVTHSYPQDSALLRSLLPLNPAYLGVLGPRRRTVQLVKEVAPQIGLSVEDCLARLHGPVGLDLGAITPAGIALSIAAEIQSILRTA